MAVSFVNKCWHDKVAPTRVAPQVDLHLVNKHGRNTTYRDNGGRAEGLRYLVPDPKMQQWSDWRTYPCVIMPFDLGPDNVSGIHALQYKFKASAEGYPDPSHGISCDSDGAVDDIGCRPLIIVGLVNANLQFGPYDEGWRGEQMYKHLQHYTKNHNYMTAELFQAIAPKLVTSLRRRGYDLGSDAEAQANAWEVIKERANNYKSGRKISLDRFLDGVASVYHTTDQWWEQWLERTLTALEEDFLKGKKFNEKILKAAGHMHVAEGGAPTKTHVSSDIKLLRGNCHNAVAISVMYLSDETNRRLLLIIRAGCGPMRAWQSKQSKANRSVEEVEQWLVEQVTGGIMQHARDFLDCLTDQKLLEEAEFCTQMFSIKRMADDLPAEDEFAYVFGQFQCHQCRRRMLRLLFHFSYPWIMTRTSFTLPFGE